MPTNVVAEFVSNSWDADATEVLIDIKAQGAAGPEIIITDNGRGMTREELTDAYLVIGRNRRNKPTDRSESGRHLMGRKGIGKLAGFGIARTIDVLTVPNLILRGDIVEGQAKLYWLRFSLDDMVSKAANEEVTGYYPEVIADGLDVSELRSLIVAHDCDGKFSEFENICAEGAGGVCVHLFDTSLKKSINAADMLASLGRRFTVTMLRADFVVKVNTKQVELSDVFPKFQDFGVGSFEQPLTDKIVIGGSERAIKYWAKFVSLGTASWPLESSGIGVFTHGKIAQDRPFFFDVKGKEVYFRYLYGSIEADWLDEMPDDVVSTDRRSVNWDAEGTRELFAWGHTHVLEWINGFQKFKQSESKKEAIQRIRKISPLSTLTGPEEEALAELLSHAMPELGNDEDAKNGVTESMTAAWTHEPMRKLTKTLWDQVFAVPGVDAAAFAILVEELRKSLVPEALGLAVTVAQRVAAITAMSKMIEAEKTETDLQRLIEEFPWLLGTEWEKLIANQRIKTLVADKYKPDLDGGGWDIKTAEAALKPDFVFLSDAGAEKEIVVFELKGPEMGKSLLWPEYVQLRGYLDILSRVYTTHKVRGVLVGHERGGFEKSDTRISVVTWSEVLLNARSLHVSYLAALLNVSKPDKGDARMKQIADFGGAETLELLRRLREITEFPDAVVNALPD